MLLFLLSILSYNVDKVNATKGVEIMAAPKDAKDRYLTPDGLIKIEAWARDGLMLKDIAKKLNIGESTLYKWKKEVPAFAEAIQRGKEVTDIIVENELFRRATGYKYNEDTFKEVFNEKTGEFEMRLIERKVKYERPDVTAQIFWLKNRQTEKWKDRRVLDAEVTMEDKSANALEGLSADELRKLIALPVEEDDAKEVDYVDAEYEELEGEE